MRKVPTLLELDFEKKQARRYIGKAKVGLMVEMKNLGNLSEEHVEFLRTVSMIDNRNPFKV
jgi:hypothetical protein